MTAPRIVVRGATTALTRRTTMRKAFLGAWHPMVEDCWLYALARAQRDTNVAVHHSVLVVSHHHTSVTPSSANLPEFTRRFHRDLSCSLHTLLADAKYDAPRELFDDRPTHAMRLLDAAAQASHLVYERLNPVAAGLVRRPEHAPIRQLDFRLWKTGFIEVERPAFYFGRDRCPERLRLHLTPPPLLYRAFGGDLDRLVHHLERLVDDGVRSIRDARSREPIGAQALRRMHPWSEPRTMRESKADRIASYKIGAYDMLGREQDRACRKEVRSYRGDHRAARIARRNGEHATAFPYGTYAMRVYHGAPTMDAPPHEAMVAMPGPLLDEVKAELAAGAVDLDVLREASRAVIDDVCDALRVEASAIVEDADLDIVSRQAVRTESASSASLDAAASNARRVQVRHRMEKRTEVDRDAVRVVTLRDRRRGRPRRGAGKHGGDPPGSTHR